MFWSQALLLRQPWHACEGWALVCRWIWAYWLSPFTWNMQAMAINEMTTPPWGPSGVEALESFGFYTHRSALLHLPRVPYIAQS